MVLLPLSEGGGDQLVGDVQLDMPLRYICRTVLRGACESVSVNHWECSCTPVKISKYGVVIVESEDVAWFFCKPKGAGHSLRALLCLREESAGA